MEEETFKGATRDTALGEYLEVFSVAEVFSGGADLLSEAMGCGD